MEQPVVAFATDLIFGVKIASTGKSLGATVYMVRSLEEFRTRLQQGARLAIIDLNAAGPDPLEAVRAARAAPSAPRTIAYLSHVQTDLADAARQAGAHDVLPRSAFSARLAEILMPIKMADSPDAPV